jgi:hypothetical protein
VARHSDAATHDNAVHHSHVRLSVVGDVGVDRVLDPEELPGIGAVGLGALPDHSDVAAGAQPALARPVD